MTVFEAREEQGIETEVAFLTLAPYGMNGLRLIGLQEEMATNGMRLPAIEILDERARRLALMDQSDHEAVFDT